MTYRLRCIAWGCAALLFATSIAPSSVASETSKPAVTGTASSDQTKQVREFMNEGAADFSNGEWEAARLAYLKAWELKRHPAIAANMAAAEMKLGQYREAAEHLKYSLKFVPLVQTEKREAVQIQLNECLAHLATLTITANVAGAVITIDTMRVGQSPLNEDVFVNPGKHKIQAFAERHEIYTQEINVEATQALTVTIQLQSSGSRTETKLQPAPSPPPATLSDARHSNATRTWTIVGGGVTTAVALGIGVAYRLKSNSDEDGANSYQTQLATSAAANHAACVGPSRPQLCDSLHDKLLTFDHDRNLSTGAFVASGVFGVVTLAAVLLWPTGGTDRVKAAHAVRVEPWSSGIGQGMRASVEF